MSSTASYAVPQKVRLAGASAVALVAVAVVIYCLVSFELMLVVPPALAALTAGGGVVGSIGSRLESRVARAVAAIVVPVAFACAAIVMITVMMRVMYHGSLRLEIMMLSAFGVGTNPFSAPFWVATASSAALYASDAEVGAQRLATTAFSVAVIATAMVIAAHYL